MGPSGSGKSTLLNLIAGLDVPDAGEVIVEGQVPATLGDGALARFRRRTVGVIFQSFNLIPALTAWENVALPLRADRRPRADVARAVEGALATVGLSGRAHHYPDELSGGEQQRVAIARVLATDARVVLADEPTGSLDSVRGEETLQLLRAAASGARAVLLVTHDQRAERFSDRIVELSDGQIVCERPGRRPRG
jgi:putative ABC transport system ATP-binding protein